MNYKIFVINLDHREDKFSSVVEQLNKFQLPCERISAVNGKDLTNSEISDIYDSDKNEKFYPKILSSGEIGCYLSHIKAWKEIINQELDYAVILEDDCKIEEHFQNFNKYIEKLQNWDYIKIAGNRGAKKIKRSEALCREASIVYYNKIPASTVGQIISYSGAQKLLENSKSIFRPVDIDIKHYWEKGINVIGIEPKLIDNIGFDSDIEALDMSATRKNSTNGLKKLKFTLMFNFYNLINSSKQKQLSNFIKSTPKI